MLLQFCDKCGRPLSEGCLARGEAVERHGELVCSNCVSVEQAKQAVRAAQETTQDTTGALGHYEQAVWSCESCGIPVTALDLIEGRASRAGGELKCSRCAPVGATRAMPAAPAPTPVLSSASRRGQVPFSTSKKAPIPAAPRKPIAVLTRAAAAPADAYVEQAKTEQRRPIIPIIVFAIVMPMFAVSLYFAVTSQVKLNEVLSSKGNTADEPVDRRQRRPQERLEPDADSPRLEPEPKVEEKPAPPEPAKGPAKKILPTEVIDDLVGIERDLAAPVIAKLQSSDLAVVWEGLIEAGSRRLIATRPYVRGLLGDKDDQTRALACRVCGMLSDREALLKLTRMVEQDPIEAVQIEARKARDRLTGEATRDIRDLSDAEIEEMLRDLKRELERRKGRSD
jgi:hypothetical protein